MRPNHKVTELRSTLEVVLDQTAGGPDFPRPGVTVVPATVWCAHVAEASSAEWDTIRSDQWASVVRSLQGMPVWALAFLRAHRHELYDRVVVAEIPIPSLLDGEVSNGNPVKHDPWKDKERSVDERIRLLMAHLAPTSTKRPTSRVVAEAIDASPAAVAQSFVWKETWKRVERKGVLADADRPKRPRAADRAARERAKQDGDDDQWQE